MKKIHFPEKDNINDGKKWAYVAISIIAIGKNTEQIIEELMRFVGMWSSGILIGNIRRFVWI